MLSATCGKLHWSVVRESMCPDQGFKCSNPLLYIAGVFFFFQKIAVNHIQITLFSGQQSKTVVLFIDVVFICFQCSLGPLGLKVYPFFVRLNIPLYIDPNWYIA